MRCAIAQLEREVIPIAETLDSIFESISVQLNMERTADDLRAITCDMIKTNAEEHNYSDYVSQVKGSLSVSQLTRRIRKPGTFIEEAEGLVVIALTEYLGELVVILKEDVDGETGVIMHDQHFDDPPESKHVVVVKETLGKNRVFYHGTRPIPRGKLTVLCRLYE